MQDFSKERILGIDPGSYRTGYGILEVEKGNYRILESGTILLPKKKALSFRLKTLFFQLKKIIKHLEPQMLVVENVFFAKDACAALKLGQVRGVVLLLGALCDLQIETYAATQVKRILTGNGRASKEQVAHVLKLLGNLKAFPTLDASDALALAFCGAFLKEKGETGGTKSQSSFKAIGEHWLAKEKERFS